MAENKFYNNVELLEEAKRYKTSEEFLDLLYHELNHCRKLLIDGLGSRLLIICSALSHHIYGVDVNQGSINRAKKFLENWKDYKNKKPFNIEYKYLRNKDFTKRIIEKYLNPPYNKYKFCLKKDFSKNIKDFFNRELASELFLHLDDDEIKDIFKKSYKHLTDNGHFIFTVYLADRENSLDKKFAELGEKVGLKRDDFIEGGVIHIKTLTNILKKNKKLYKKYKEKYWLDLEKVRVFSLEEISKLYRGTRLSELYRKPITGGMFSFADRFVYVMSK